MLWKPVLELLVLTVLYAAIILSLVWLLRRAGIPARWAILLGFLGFGVGSSLLSAWAWPFDSSVYPNVWATLLGDRLYALSADRLGDVWLLRVPPVYVMAAALLYGGLGLLCQWACGRAQGQEVEAQ
jgi:hypothetical protein